LNRLYLTFDHPLVVVPRKSYLIAVRKSLGVFGEYFYGRRGVAVQLGGILERQFGHKHQQKG